jgi:teichuronic acid biosynthesis glycosyltransferase TuaC
VVAMNVGGVVEHVISGKNGIAIEPGNDEALVSALSSLTGDLMWRERLGRNAREDMVRNASVAELPRYLSQLYPLRRVGWKTTRGGRAGARPRREPPARWSEALRVLAVTNIYPTAEWPTAGVFLREQLEGLRRNGVQVEVLLIDRLTQGVRSYVRVGDRVVARVKDFDPHLVHVLYGGVIADRVTRAVRDRPVVVTYHGSDLQGSVLARTRVRLMAKYGVWCSRRVARLASGVVIVSEHLRQLLPQGSVRRDARVIPCGIDLERFTPEDHRAARDRLGWSQEGFHVLFATSKDDPIKRPDLARKAVEQLRGSGVPVEFHVMSDVPYDDVPTWLNASDALLLTSLREGSPTVVKEALACNRPVVSVAVGDVPEQIAGVAGCYLAEPTPESLAEMLARVAGGPRRVDGRERAARYDTRRIAARLKEFYGEVLGNWQTLSAPAFRAASGGGP